MRHVAGGRAVERSAASTSVMSGFETEILTLPKDLELLMNLVGEWVNRVHQLKSLKHIILDMDSSVSPTYGNQEGSAYNGFFEYTCYHPLFCFSQFGDLERALLRNGNVHSADDWRSLLEPIGRYHSFRYQAASWKIARRVVAKIEWHAGELFPRVNFVVTNLRWKPSNVVKFYNKQGTSEQWIKEGKYALNWTRRSCHDFVDNQVRLQLFALAYNLGNFLRRLALSKSVKQWSLRTLRDKLIKIGAKVIRHSRYVTFQMAEVAVPRALFREILHRIRQLRSLTIHARPG
jgi:hypothetical protein